MVGSVQTTDAFADRFGKLPHTKSKLHLSYNQPMPWEMLRKMTAFCVQERLKESFMEYPYFSFCKRKNMDILRVSLLAFSGFGWYTKDAALRCLFQIWRLHGNLKSNCKGPCNKAKILKESWYGI